MDVGFGSGTRALEQALEKTKANIKWVKENKEVVLKWFTEHSQIVPGAYSHLAPM